MKKEENKKKFVGELNGKSVLTNKSRVELVENFLSNKYTRKELANMYSVSLSLVYKLTYDAQLVLKKYGETYDTISTG